MTNLLLNAFTVIGIDSMRPSPSYWTTPRVRDSIFYFRGPVRMRVIPRTRKSPAEFAGSFGLDISI